MARIAAALRLEDVGADHRRHLVVLVQAGREPGARRRRPRVPGDEGDVAQDPVHRGDRRAPAGEMLVSRGVVAELPVVDLAPVRARDQAVRRGRGRWR